MCTFSFSRPRSVTFPSKKPSKFYSFQAKCEFILLDRDMEIYQSKEAEDLFLSPGVRYYRAGHDVRDPRFAFGYFASQFRLQTFGEDKGTLTTG